MSDWIVPRQVFVSNVRAMDRWAGNGAESMARAGLSPADLEGRRAFTWTELAMVMNAFGAERTDDELAAFGEEYVNAFPGFRELASLFVAPAMLYRFVIRASPRYWAELDFDVDERPSGTFHVRSRAHPACAPNRPFFASAIGMFRALGGLVGAPHATVAVHELSSHHNRFSVEVPRARDLKSRIEDVRLAEEMRIVVGALMRVARLGSDGPDVSRSAAPSVYDLKSRFGLTVSEARLARRLASGMTLKAAGLDLGIRHETARSHLKRVMEKANVDRQADLVRVLVTKTPSFTNR